MDQALRTRGKCFFLGRSRSKHLDEPAPAVNATFGNAHLQPGIDVLTKPSDRSVPGNEAREMRDG